MAVAPRYWRRGGIGTLLIEEIRKLSAPDTDTLWVELGTLAQAPLL